MTLYINVIIYKYRHAELDSASSCYKIIIPKTVPILFFYFPISFTGASGKLYASQFASEIFLPGFPPL